MDKNTKTALSGVRLKVSIDGKMVQQHTTDGSGRLLISLPQSNFNRVFVTARKAGIAPIKVHLWRASTPETRDSSIVRACDWRRHSGGWRRS